MRRDFQLSWLCLTFNYGRDGENLFLSGLGIMRITGSYMSAKQFHK